MKSWSLRSGSKIVDQSFIKTLIGGMLLLVGSAGFAAECARTLTADVVALDMPLMFNRLGAQNINGMMYALKQDVVTLGAMGVADNTPLTAFEANSGDIKTLAGLVTLRPDKRPRPLVLRMGAGDCMVLTLTNLLDPNDNPFQIPPPVVRSGIEFNVFNDNQVAPRNVSLRFQGTELVNDILDDGTLTGTDDDLGQLATPGGMPVTYTIYAPYDGAYAGVSYGGVLGGEGLGGTTASGLFAVLNVSPKGSTFYRSAVTNEELELVTTGYTLDGQPIIDYEAVYPPGEPWVSEGKAGLPILNMVQGNAIVHTALDAIVAYTGSDNDFDIGTPGSGPYAGDLGHFPMDTYPLESENRRNPTVPNRLEPHREFTIAFHDEVHATQAFPAWFNDDVFRHTLHGVRDAFMINYGSGGIGSEIIANRLGVGAMHDCVNCAYEEFFLTFHAVGEVGQLTDIPANAGLELCDPGLNNCLAVGPKANFVLYPDDPSNVHHAYQSDKTVFRNIHAGPGEQHVFHLHNHQWLFNANDDNSNYLDAQGIGPGSGYTYEINFGGAGNRIKTAGDAIFHCHFYPHFAQGMWEMWRIHDTFEPGTELQVTEDGGGVHESFVVDGLGIGNGTPAEGARALPDGEVVAGAPTPALIPLPGKAMPPMPAIGVTVRANDNLVEVCADAGGNPIPTPANGICAVGTTMRPVGSLVTIERDPTPEVFEAVDGNMYERYGAYGSDGQFGFDEWGDSDDVNVGYPFWIAGMEHTIGNRPPTPPLDMMTADQAENLPDNDLWSHPAWGNADAIDGWDGGLPRFAVQGYSAGGKTMVALTRLDMSKEIERAKPVFFAEEGTDVEQIAMAYHALRCHDTWRTEGDYGTMPPDVYADEADCDYEAGGQGGYVTNGGLPIAGAPYMDPCIDDTGYPMYGGTGNFFDGSLAPIWDTSAMTTTGLSPYTGSNPRVYKAAAVQFDAVFNKLGYHFPQQRITTLWQDVVPTIKQERPPEPFVMRLNTFDCAQYVHSNVVPKAYELDDYQVRTPTDIIGQHIHLPKWDLPSADGSANGWNYEDGTLSPEAVVEMIHAINAWNDDADDGLFGVGVNPVTTTFISPITSRPVVDSAGNELGDEGIDDIFLTDTVGHPFFGQTVFADNWVGARSTIQRWFVDPVVNVQGVDRGLGIIFTHDHYGPSTHQQIGLYATLLIEPAGSVWYHNETGDQLYDEESGRIDGGPTSWQAAILTGEDDDYDTSVRHDDIESYREFYFEYSDFQHAYQPGVFVGMEYDAAFNWTPTEGPYMPEDANHDGIIDLATTRQGDPNGFRAAVQPPRRLEAPLRNGFPLDIWEFPPDCLGGVARPCPEAITADDPGMYVVNYRNEPLAARIYDPNKLGPDGNPGTQADGRAGDLAFATASNVNRRIPELNTVMGLAPPSYFDSAECDDGTGALVFCPPITSPDALSKRDPFTPMPRVNDGDRVFVKMQGGGQEEEHSATAHGLKWLQAGSGFGEAKNSGWRNSQSSGISEQFSIRMPMFSDYNNRGDSADYAYSMNPSIDGWNSGTWGIIRSYKPNGNSDLPSIKVEDGDFERLSMRNANEFDRVCPRDAPTRSYDVTAVSANDVIAAGDLPAGIVIDDPFPLAHEGASPTGDGTLVYNPRQSVVSPIIEIDEVTGLPVAVAGTGGMGPLHDPTSIIYVETDRLVSIDPEAAYCAVDEMAQSPACPVTLADGASLEPLVIRANAGDCIEITLRNRVLQPASVQIDGVDYLIFNAKGELVVENLFANVHEDGTIDADPLELIWRADVDLDGTFDDDTAADGNVDPLILAADLGAVTFDETLDLANGNALSAIVRRDPGFGIQGMTSFNNNLMQPSAHVGMRPQLVEYDVTRSDGFNIGQNPNQTAAPGETVNYQWYAGDIDISLTYGRRGRLEGRLEDTPIEYGGFNIMSADPIEQGQKGLIAAGVIYPEGSQWVVDPGRSTVATVYDADGEFLFRDFTTIAAKGLSLRYANSDAVENLLGEGDFGVAEDSQDMGHMAINYGNEAMWFRFGKNPTNVGGNAACNGAAGTCLGGIGDADANLAFANSLPGVGTDPETAVFAVKPDDEFRMHVLLPFAPGRGSTFDLHGHVWQRDPYVCEGDSDLGLDGKCSMGVDGLPQSGSVGSQSIGFNPIGFHIGGSDSWFATEHYEIVIPSAGGTGPNGGVPGDYLFRDHMGLGNTAGLWGIVRVDGTTEYPDAPAADPAPVPEPDGEADGENNNGNGNKNPKKNR